MRTDTLQGGRDAPNWVGSSCFSRCNLKDIGIPPSNITPLVVDTARLRRRGPNIAGLWCMKTVMFARTVTVARTQSVSLGEDLGKYYTSHTCISVMKASRIWSLSDLHVWVCNVLFLAVKTYIHVNHRIPVRRQLAWQIGTKTTILTLFWVLWHACLQEPKSLLSLAAQPFTWSSPAALPVLIYFHLIGDWWACSGGVWQFQQPVWCTALHCISEQKARKWKDSRLLLLLWGNLPLHR